MKCVLSIMWRSIVNFLAIHQSKENNLQPQDYTALDQALSNIKNALNGKMSFKINFMHFTPVNVSAHGLPAYNKNAYFYDRSVAEDIRFENSGATLWLKIPRVIFWIHAEKEISNNERCVTEKNPKDIIKLNAFLTCLIEQLDISRKDMSENQLKKIANSLQPDKSGEDWSASAKREAGNR
ncbi:hypothetical protein LZZ50_02775 [Xanthomonas arboricola]|uniref:hypothetical protein n=1 Tax=Xanthomonas arboricola TaxID=56448 RepID=UPI001FD6540A|nr:hypothetical protein [Xanthomonas arboricola]UOS99318.1 hypothetical protein LZZ50_02775 [Xanthomonas arboricola]